MQTTSTMEKLFLEMGFYLTDLEINTPIDVSNKQYEVQTSDKEGNIVWAKITKIVRKPPTKAYIIYINNCETLICSSNHRISVVLDIKNQTKPVYIEVSKLLKQKYILANTINGLKEITIKKTNNIINIIDMEIEGTHCYYSSGILSHNTRFGNPESLPGGKGLKFLSSLMIRTRRGKWLTDTASDSGGSIDFDEVPDDKEAKRIGFLLRLRVEKNKIAPPYEECDLKFFFNGTVDWVNSLVHLAITNGLIIEEKQAYFRVPEIEKLIHGRNALEDLLRNNEELKQSIIKQLKGK